MRPARSQADLVILAPVLRRPHRVKPLLDSARAATPGARVLFVCDPDDEEEIAEVDRLDAERILVAGNYAAKINQATLHTDSELLFLAADDLHFHPGWFEAASARLTRRVGVVGTNDLANPRVLRGVHSTHSLVARWYCHLGTIDEPDKLLHESYPHEFVDDEFVATAKHRGAFVAARDSIVEHLHPMVGKAPMDDLYAAQRTRMRAGRRIYRRRRKLWMQPSS